MSSTVYNNIFFRQWKPHVSNIEYQKNSLIANIACVMTLVIFFYYFFCKMKTNLKSKKE